VKFVLASLAVRALFLLFHRIDSDEPQHLHVAWGWSQGLVQYRDLFDNHFPLLHLLFAPVMAVMPETSATLWWMRLAIAPFAIACAWLVFELGKPLIGARPALLAAATFSVLPPWLPKSIEFRNDVLWVFFWLASLVLVQRRRNFAAGVCAGLCVLASVKALPLLLAHALVLVTLRQRVPLTRFASGAAVPIAICAAFFASLGALDELLHATLFFNASLPVDTTRRIGGALAFVVIAPPLVRFRPAARHPLFAHLGLFAIWFTLVLLCFWPHLTPRDFLPLVPIAALAIAATPIPPLLVLIAGTLAAAAYEPIWEREPSRAHFIDAAVAITRPDEFVFDLKGDAIFRRRPVYPIYDVVGRALIGNGTLPDETPEQLVAKRCCAAIPDMTHIPARTRAFLNAHFVDRGAVRVCGTVARNGTFTIAVPQMYAVLARDPSRVVIDGVAYRGPRFLNAGPHTLTAAGEDVTVIWAGAQKVDFLDLTPRR
jgi:hypothetical protein